MHRFRCGSVIPECALILVCFMQKAPGTAFDFNLEFRNRLPVPYRLYKAEAVDSLRAWVAGDFGTIFRTVDGGRNWSMWQLPGKRYQSDIQDIDFVDSLNGWLDATDSLFVTSDGGRTWAPRCGSRDFHYVNFIDSLRGWASGFENVFRTTNGGKTWDTIATKSPSGIRDHFFVDSRHGWIIKDDGDYRVSIHHTNDSGRTWNLQEGPTTIFFHSLKFIDSLHGICSSEKAIHYTNNGGAEWRDIGFNYDSYLNDVAIFDSANYWAVGRTGSASLDKAVTRAIHIEDFNKGITQIPISRPYQLYAVAPFTAHKAVIAGDCGSLYCVQTIGDSSYDVHEIAQGNSNTLYDVMFTRSGVGWTVGSHGSILRSLDNGATWSEIAGPNSMDFRKVFFLDQDTGWVIYDNAIARTHNGGQTWEIFSVTRYTSQNLTFVNSTDGYSTSIVDGRFRFTTDGGKTWQDYYTAFRESSRFGIKSTDSLNAWLNNGNGLVARTTDGGLTWKLPYLTKKTSSAFFTDTGHGCVADSDGTIWQYNSTANPAVHSSHLSNCYGKSIVYTDSVHAWVTGLYEWIHISADGGYSWEDAHFAGNAIESFAVDRAGNVWAVGRCGMIAKLAPVLRQPTRTASKPAGAAMKIRVLLRGETLVLSGIFKFPDLILKIYTLDGRLAASIRCSSTGDRPVTVRMPVGAIGRQIYVAAITTKQGTTLSRVPVHLQARY